jgi:DNA-binding beta-propeller fold protein YncE
MAATATHAYTGSLGVNQIASISLADQKVNVTNVPGPNHSFVQFVVSRKVPVLVASTDVSGQILWFDIGTPASPMLIKTIDVGKMAFDPVLTPDEEFVWVPVKSSNELVVISTDAAKVVARIKDDNLRQPQQIAFSADGAWAFVTNNNKMDHMADPAHAGHEMPASDGIASLVVINTKTMKVDQAIPLGRNLTGMGRK